VSRLSYRQFYRRHLPHIQPPGATLFVTFRLSGSMPGSVGERLAWDAERSLHALDDTGQTEERKRQAYLELKRSFATWDDCLHGAKTGPTWLGRREVARLVAEALHERDGREYDLLAFCVMPNHVHVVLAPLRKDDGCYHSLSSIMRSLKGRTAREANLVLGRRGAFWQHENHDHVVRDEAELSRIVAYVLDNPVRAGLAQGGEEWKWSYSQYEL
jgi:REP element-mobilizing transposase RayT